LPATVDRHLDWLGRLEEEDIARLYHTIYDNQPWPEIENEPLNPVAVVLFSLGRMAMILGPDRLPTDFAELRASAHAVGRIAQEYDSIRAVVKAAMTPPIMDGNRVDDMYEAAKIVAESVAEIIGLNLEEKANGEGTEETARFH